MQKRDGSMAAPPVANSHFASFVNGQICSDSAMAAWDTYLSKCLKKPDPVSVPMMEMALYFNVQCHRKVSI